MAIRSRYSMMGLSDQTDGNGNNYFDVLSFPINFFRYNEYPSSTNLNEGDLLRWDLFTFDKYGDLSFKDFLLWVNKVGDKHLLEIGDYFILPALGDLRNFYSNFLQNVV